MSRPDASASAALGAQVIRPVFLCYLDILGDPVRANTSGATIQFAATGNPDLDGYTFDGIDPTIIDISPVRTRGGGSDSVSARLSGILSLDADLLALIADKANWQGRTAQLWRMIRDEYGAQQGAVQHYYTGWMTALDFDLSPESQAINLTIESYLAAFGRASGRTYMDQELYDPSDQSARAAIAIANGNSGNPLVSNTGGGAGGSSGGGGYGGGGRYLNEMLR